MGCACRVTPLRIFIQGLSQVHKIEPSYSLRLRVPVASITPNCNQLRLTRLLHASRRLNQESNISAASSPLTATNSEGTAATTGEFSFTYENRSEPVEPAKTIEPPKTIKPVTTTKSTTTIEGPFAHENHNDSVKPAIPVKPPKKVEPVTVQPARTAEAVTTPEIVTTIEHTTSQPTTTTDFATAKESPTASEPSNVKKSIEGYQQAQVDQPTEGAEIYKRKSTLPNSNFEYRGKFQGRDKFRGKDRLQVYKERRFRGDKPIGENKFKDKPWKPKSYLDDSLDEFRPWKKRGDDTDSSWQPRKFKASSASFEPIVGRSPSEPAPDVPAWKIQKQALKEKFPDGWAPRKRLSPDALAGIRALNAQFPDTYTTSTLASRFEVSPENIRRILKGGWQPTAEEEKDRQDRWFRRGMKLWDHKAELGMKPPRKWRLEGIKRDPSYYDKRQGAIKRNRQLEEKDDREIQARFRKSVPSAGKY